MKPTAIIYRSVTRRVPKLLKRMVRHHANRMAVQYMNIRPIIIENTRSARGL